MCAMEKSVALLKAIEKSGSVTALAEYLGIKSQAVSQWRRAPAKRVLDIERASGVSRHELRPDLYPRPRRGAAPKPVLPIPTPIEKRLAGRPRGGPPKSTTFIGPVVGPPGPRFRERLIEAAKIGRKAVRL